MPAIDSLQGARPRCGSWGASSRADLSGVYRPFLRVASPGFVLARTSNIYSLYTRECGTLRAIAKSPRLAEVAMENRPFPSEPFYQYMCGTFAGAIELTGVHDIRVSIRQGGGTEPRCLFVVEWR